MAQNIQAKPRSDALRKTGHRVQVLPERAPPLSLRSLQIPVSSAQYPLRGAFDMNANADAILDPSSNVRLTPKETRVVARVAGKIHPRPLSNSCNNVEMPGNMPRAVDNVD